MTKLIMFRFYDGIRMMHIQEGVFRIWNFESVLPNIHSMFQFFEMMDYSREIMFPVGHRIIKVNTDNL